MLASQKTNSSFCSFLRTHSLLRILFDEDVMDRIVLAHRNNNFFRLHLHYKSIKSKLLRIILIIANVLVIKDVGDLGTIQVVPNLS